MAWLRHAGREDSVLDGVSPPLRGLASDFGKTRSLWQITPKVFSPTCSPSCVGFPQFTRLSHGTRRWALTFAIPGVGQSPLRTSMSLRQTGPSVARPIPVWPMAQRRSLGVLPRGLDKRAHLGEQQGATPNPPPRGLLIGVGCNKRSALHRGNSPQPIRGKDRMGCYLAANPSPTPWRD